MSTPTRGPVGTGGHDPLPQAAPKAGDTGPAQPEMTDPPSPEVEAEIRKRATANVDVPAGTALITSRLPEPTLFDIMIDSDNILTSSQTTSGFLVWYCPDKLLPRLKKHYLVTSDRVVLPEGVSTGSSDQPAQTQHPATQKAPPSATKPPGVA